MRSIRDAHLKADFKLTILPIVIFLSFAQQVIFIVASWPFSQGEKQHGPQTMGKLCSNTRELTQGNEKELGEDSSYRKRIEVLLRETARKSFPDPEKVDNPMVAPHATFREMPVRNHRGRLLAKLEARDEAKKQNTLKIVLQRVKLSQMESIILSLGNFCLARMELRRDT